MRPLANPNTQNSLAGIDSQPGTFLPGVCRTAPATQGRTRSAGVDLAVAELSKSFDGRSQVLHDVQFQVSHGESVALIGPNGCGKSTLLRCCMGLIKADRGSVRLLGEEISGVTPAQLRRLRSKVGFIFQQHNLVPRLSVLSNVMHGALYRRRVPMAWFHSLAPRVERERALHYLEMVRLADLAGRRADQLSGGQSQRVAIARTLMQQPFMVIADEPVASLDPRAGEEVMDLFADLMRREKVTVIFTSHHLEHALLYSERILALQGGAMMLDASTASLNIPSLRGIYDQPGHAAEPDAAAV